MSKEKLDLKSSGEDSKAINLKNLVESIVGLTVNQRFISQIHEANTIEEVAAKFRELVLSWRSDPYLFCNADVMNSILNLIEEYIDADVELRQLIEDVENWLNKNYIYSQSVASQQSQGSVHEDEVHHLSQMFRSQSLTQEDSKSSDHEEKEDEGNNILYATDYMVDIPVVLHHAAWQYPPETHNPQPNSASGLSQGSDQSYNNSYDVHSQESFVQYAQYSQPEVVPDNQQDYYDGFPNAQPVDWGFNLTQLTNATQETNVDDYEEGETDQEDETQQINFCSNLIYNNLPDDIYNKPLSSEKNNFEINDIVSPDFKFYDFSVLTSLLAMLSLSIEVIYVD